MVSVVGAGIGVWLGVCGVVVIWVVTLRWVVWEYSGRGRARVVVGGCGVVEVLVVVVVLVRGSGRGMLR